MNEIVLKVALISIKQTEQRHDVKEIYFSYNYIPLRHSGQIQYSRNNLCRPFFIVIQIWVGMIFMNGLNIHEYNAYPYLINNKVWPA